MDGDAADDVAETFHGGGDDHDDPYGRFVADGLEEGEEEEERVEG